MLLKFKILGGRDIDMDFDETTTVGIVKDNLKSSQNLAGDFKVIFKGKTLNNTSTLLDTGAKSGDKFMVMLPKETSDPTQLFLDRVSCLLQGEKLQQSAINSIVSGIRSNHARNISSLSPDDISRLSKIYCST